MKNNFIIILIFVSFSNFLFAEELDIKAKNITIDKKKNITIFEGNVELKDEFNNKIKSDYIEYNKITNFLKLQGKIILKDTDNNIFNTSVATYDNNNKIFKSFGESNFKTFKGYSIKTSDLIINYKNFSVISNKEATIEDLDGNKINLENFEYLKEKNIFKSIGKINLTDKLNNIYKFTQLYIDEEKQEIIGSDAKIFINNEDFKINNKNKPRVFANTISINNNKTTFIKSNFTMCDYRKNDKCPPWEMKASKMTHDAVKKTIYYDNAVIKLYNLPIFYLPKLSHPDPSVDRRSGFLTPSYTDTKHLGSGLSIPYFWAIDKDRDLTLNNKLFVSEHPLFLGEYRQAFKDSSLIFDFGYTEGYKKESSVKKLGNKSHFFINYLKNFNSAESINNNLEVNLQHVSNKKYLKLYKIDSNLADYETEVLENYIDFSSFDENKNSFFSINLSSFKSLADTYNDKYEYILPEINYEKQLFSNSFGYGNFESNFKVHNYDTNKYSKFLTNDIDWFIEKPFSERFFDGKFLAKFKNVNYEVKNINSYKTDTTNELFGAFGYLASLNLFKNKDDQNKQFLTPKLMFKYAPNYMRKEEGEFNLANKNLFQLDRLQSNQNFEGGTNLTLGLDYEIDKDKSKTTFSVAQIINEKKNNKKIPDTSSLDKRFSDIIGNFNYKKNENFSLDYNFSLKQNFKETSRNDLIMKYDYDNISFNLNYLEEEKKTGENEYIRSDIEYKNNDSGVFTFSNKRNLITNSSEFYNLSYEYIIDCLRAGIFYRREFYNDSEIEADDSLMFKITLSSFGSINSPSFNK
jgi:LPS-assembly protein